MSRSYNVVDCTSDISDVAKVDAVRLLALDFDCVVAFRRCDYGAFDGVASKTLVDFNLTYNTIVTA